MSGAGEFDRRIRIERKVVSTSLMSAGQNDWQTVMILAASYVPVLPSRSDRLDDTLNITKSPARIRTYYRPGVTAEMRVVLFGRGAGEADKILKIVSGPAEIDRKKKMELMVEDFSTKGQPA